MAYMALLNVHIGLRAMLADWYEMNITMASAHVALGGLQLALAVIVLPIDADQTRRALGDGDPMEVVT
jgi:hypothetical protein